MSTQGIVAAVDHLLDVATGHRNMTQDEADSHREAIAQNDPPPAPDAPQDGEQAPAPVPVSPGPENPVEPAGEGVPGGE